MADISRTFHKGVMNQDLDERLLPNGSYISAQNVTVNSYASGDVGAIQNAYGNLLVSTISQLVTSPTVSNPIVIGAVVYEPKGLIYWLVTANEFDAIFELSLASNGGQGQVTRVLQCSKPNPGSPLNFNANQIVTGINYIEGQDGNNYLFWTDNYNPPRRININRCKGYTADDPSIADDISVVMAPPLNAPYISLSQDNNPDSTNLKEKFVYFSYRYKYIDNEYSSMSPFSAVGFEAGSFAIDYDTGDNLGMINKKNKINIEFETGNEFVKEIQLLVRDTRSLNVMVIESFKKDELSIQNNTTHSFTFRNNKIYTTLSNDQVTRLFDNVPLKALAQDVIGNRLIYGNYLQFRNITNANDVDININFTVNYVSELISGNNPKRSFRSDRDYEVGIVYTDEYGRMTTVLTPALSNAVNQLSNSVYIPPTASNSANSLRVEIKHDPPSWATNYRLVLKQNRHEYYNIFPRLYVGQGLFRYFLINESDRDKFGVGDYVIIKKGSSSSPTYSNKQYKILETEVKPAGFNNITTAPEGLYFKIKIEPNDTSILPTNGTQTFTFTTQATNKLNCNTGNQRNSVTALLNANSVNVQYGYTSKPVFYGSLASDSSALSTTITSSFTGNTVPGLNLPVPSSEINKRYFYSKDLRYTIEIKPGNKFNYTVDLFGVSNWIEVNDIPIVVGQVYKIKTPTHALGNTFYGNGYNQGPFAGLTLNNTANYAAFFIQFNSNSFSIGDKWKIGGRTRIPPAPTVSALGMGSNYFGSSAITNSSVYSYQEGLNGGMAVLSGTFSGSIFAGASITIQVLNDRYNNLAYASPQTFTSPQTYENIEEWFVESGAWTTFISKGAGGNSTDQGAKPIWFRETTGPVNVINPNNGLPTNQTTYSDTSQRVTMFMMGYGNKQGCKQNIFEVRFTINQISPSNSIIFETVPLDTETEIFHELSRTFPIKNGKHISRWFFTSRSNGPSSSTRLIQSTKEWPHYFTAGDTVYINTNGVSPATQHTIIGTPNRYIIDVTPSMSVLPSFPGSVSYTTYEQDQTSVTNGAKIQVNYPNYPNGDYNSFTYNTGLETHRIKDAFNAPVMRYSPRVTSIIEDYEEEHKFASLTYSGVFQATTSTNKLNEFNLSLANFKNLDKRYGSVQKLKARDTDLLTLHQDKITSVLYGKNLLYDAVGGSQVASIPEVLGNQIAYPGEFGISDNPESFATWGDVCYFADEKRGSVIKLIGNEVIPISTQGMGSFWIDTMRDNPNNFKFGGFDPYNGLYVISLSDRQKQYCDLSLSPTIKNVNSSVSNGPVFMFSVNSLSPSWQISIVDNGFGTSWVNCQTIYGSYSQFVYASYASNPSLTPRSVIFRVTYCGTLFKDFLLTQGGVRATAVIIPMVNG
jgi:hypothetical protein